MKRFLFVLLLLFLPSQLGYHFWPTWSLVNGIRVDYLSPTLYFTDLLAVAIIFLESRQLRLKRTYIYIAGVFIVVNTLISQSPFVTLFAWLKIVEFIVLGYVFYLDRNEVRPLSLKILPFTLLWTDFLAIAQWLKSSSLNSVFYWVGERSFTIQTPGIALSKISQEVSLRPYATLPHPNALAGFVLVVWLYLLTLHEKNRLFYITTILTFVTLFLTESYSAWIALFFSLLSLIFTKHWREKVKYVKVPAISIFFLISIAALLVSTTPFVSHFSTNSRERMELLYISGVSVSKHPLLGSGLGTFIVEIPQYTKYLPNIFRTRATSWLQPVHNIPLLVFSETGVLGLISLFISVCQLPTVLPVIALLVISLFDHYWVTLQAPALAFAIIVGLTYNSHKKR